MTEQTQMETSMNRD